MEASKECSHTLSPWSVSVSFYLVLTTPMSPNRRFVMETRATHRQYPISPKPPAIWGSQEWLTLMRYFKCRLKLKLPV